VQRVITTHHGTAQFPDIRTMVEADLRGWLPMMGVILTEEQIGRILQQSGISVPTLPLMGELRLMCRRISSPR